MEIRTNDVTAVLGGVEIIKGINVTVGKREFVGIIGPNGSGKSTLLKCIYRVLRPSVGAVLLDGKELLSYSVRESAKRISVLSQSANVVFEFTVMEMVLMGRSPHKRALERDNAEDYSIARNALETVGMNGFEERLYSTLSGGECQRVMLAQALAQRTPCLVLDEPTNHLDVKYQLQIMSIVKNLDITVIAAIHDLNIAAMYCDRLYVVNEGEIVAEGKPENVLTPEQIKKVYGVEAQIMDSGAGQLYIAYKKI